MKLRKQQKRILKDAELLNLVTRIIVILRTVPVDADPMLTELTATLEAAAETLNDAFNRARASKLTVDINAQDAVRDAALETIRDMIDAFLKKRKEASRKAAELLKEIWDKAFEGININNNSEESTGIVRFLEMTKTEEAEQAVGIVCIEEEMFDLAKAQPEYERLVLERSSIQKNDNTPLLRPSRRDVHKELAMLEELTEYRLRHNHPVYAGLVNELNGAITTVFTAAQARATREENGEAEQ